MSWLKSNIDGHAGFATSFSGPVTFTIRDSSGNTPTLKFTLSIHPPPPTIDDSSSSTPPRTQFACGSNGLVQVYDPLTNSLLFFNDGPFSCGDQNSLDPWLETFSVKSEWDDDANPRAYERLDWQDRPVESDKADLKAMLEKTAWRPPEFYSKPNDLSYWAKLRKKDGSNWLMEELTWGRYESKGLTDRVNILRRKAAKQGVFRREYELDTEREWGVNDEARPWLSDSEEKQLNDESCDYPQVNKDAAQSVVLQELRDDASRAKLVGYNPVPAWLDMIDDEQLDDVSLFMDDNDGKAAAAAVMEYQDETGNSWEPGQHNREPIEAIGKWVRPQVIGQDQYLGEKETYTSARLVADGGDVLTNREFHEELACEEQVTTDESNCDSQSGVTDLSENVAVYVKSLVSAQFQDAEELVSHPRPGECENRQDDICAAPSNTSEVDYNTEHLDYQWQRNELKKYGGAQCEALVELPSNHALFGRLPDGSIRVFKAFNTAFQMKNGKLAFDPQEGRLLYAFKKSFIDKAKDTTGAKLLTVEQANALNSGCFEEYRDSSPIWMEDRDTEDVPLEYADFVVKLDRSTKNPVMVVERKAIRADLPEDPHAFSAGIQGREAALTLELYQADDEGGKRKSTPSVHALEGARFENGRGLSQYRGKGLGLDVNETLPHQSGSYGEAYIQFAIKSLAVLQGNPEWHAQAEQIMLRQAPSEICGPSAYAEDEAEDVLWIWNKLSPRTDGTPWTLRKLAELNVFLHKNNIGHNPWLATFKLSFMDGCKDPNEFIQVYRQMTSEGDFFRGSETDPRTEKLVRAAYFLARRVWRSERYFCEEQPDCSSFIPPPVDPEVTEPNDAFFLLREQHPDRLNPAARVHWWRHSVKQDELLPHNLFGYCPDGVFAHNELRGYQDSREPGPIPIEVPEWARPQCASDCVGSAPGFVISTSGTPLVNKLQVCATHFTETEHCWILLGHCDNADERVQEAIDMQVYDPTRGLTTAQRILHDWEMKKQSKNGVSSLDLDLSSVAQASNQNPADSDMVFATAYRPGPACPPGLYASPHERYENRKALDQVSAPKPTQLTQPTQPDALQLQRSGFALPALSAPPEQTLICEEVMSLTNQAEAWMPRQPVAVSPHEYDEGQGSAIYCEHDHPDDDSTSSGTTMTEVSIPEKPVTIFPREYDEGLVQDEHAHPAGSTSSGPTLEQQQAAMLKVLLRVPGWESTPLTPEQKSGLLKDLLGIGQPQRSSPHDSAYASGHRSPIGPFQTVPGYPQRNVYAAIYGGNGAVYGGYRSHESVQTAMLLEILSKRAATHDSGYGSGHGTAAGPNYGPYNPQNVPPWRRGSSGTDKFGADIESAE